MRVPMLVLGCLLAGCLKEPVDGFEVREGVWTKQSDQIVDLASTDLACPKEDIQVEIRAIDETDDSANLVDASGCGLERTYLRPMDANYQYYGPLYTWMPLGDIRLSGPEYDTESIEIEEP